jgi:V/A-type H+-transporting ATPase subunit E
MADLATLLESEAAAEIEQILAEARAQADGRVRAANEQAQALLESRRRALEHELAAGLVRARSAADLESAALRLGANHDATAKAFEAAEEQLRAYTRTSEYTTTLVKLITEAQGALGQIERLEASPTDLPAVQAAARQAGVVATVTASPDVETGIRAYGPGSRSAASNTLLGRLGRSREALAGDVARLLAPTEPGAAGER